MTEEERLSKNARIKESKLATLAKRANQTRRVFKVKIDYSLLSTRQREALHMIFTEAKWIYNAILNFSKDNPVEDWKRYPKEVNVMNRDKEFETRELKRIGSQMKDAMKAKVINAIKALHTLKERKKQKPGKLKFKSSCNSIDLGQYGVTYSIESPKQVRIQKVPGRIRVRGLDQFLNTPGIEFANAKLLNTPLGYYLAITTYVPKEVKDEEYLPKIGIDMGIKTSITPSIGKLIDVVIEETERLKKLQRKMFRRQKGSNNRYKIRKLLDKEYQKISNRKDDIANKIVANLLKHKTVYMQDENLQGWKIQNGKKVQHSIMGRVKAKLIHHERVVVLNQWVPTTKYCPVCHLKNEEIERGDNTFICPYCGLTEDRDIHAAKNMIIMAEEGFPLKDDRRKAAWQMIRDLDDRSRDAAEELNNMYLGNSREVTPMEIESSTASVGNIAVAASSIIEVGRSHPLGWD